jgi:ferredoxin
MDSGEGCAMAMEILAGRCADCRLCIELCPVSAIQPPDRSRHRLTTEIDPERCTECVGHFAWPRCVAFCRVGGIVKNLDRIENRTSLVAKWNLLTGGLGYSQDSPYPLEPIQELGEPVA